MTTITIAPDTTVGTISRHLYGHFSEHLGRCIYGGFWVGEDSPIPNTRGIRNDVVAALRQIAIPNLRWPGGCFADEYHWRDGIGPREQRPTMINTHWGGVTENNHFGTHEFLDLCGQLGCEPYICGNVGSGTVQEMSQWVEYLNSDNVSPLTKLRQANGRKAAWGVKYFGVGNENWGCGGNMRPEYYADEYRRYVTYCRTYGEHKLFRIAGGAAWTDYNWTEVLMREAGRFMDGLSLHEYVFPKEWECKGAATGFGQDEWFSVMKKTIFVEELLAKHIAIMDRHDPERRIALIVDEWGNWHDVEPGTNPGFLYQQNSIRDAVSAAMTLNLFNRNCARVRMANIAQTVNVLQAMLLTEGDRLVRTPTFHVFDLFKIHHDATALACTIETPEYRFGEAAIPAISVSASRQASGAIGLTLCNCHAAESATVQVDLPGTDAATPAVAGRLLTAPELDSHNRFDHPDAVRPVPYTTWRWQNGRLYCDLPPRSVVALTLS